MFLGQRIASTKLEYNHVVDLKKGVGQKGDNQKYYCTIYVCV